MTKSRMENPQIVLYQTEDGQTRLEVRLQDETLWLTQAAMAELFQTSAQNITLHLKAIYSEGELAEESTCKDYLHVQTDSGDIFIAMSDATTGKIGKNNSDKIYFMNQRVGKVTAYTPINSNLMVHFLSLNQKSMFVTSNGSIIDKLSKEQYLNFTFPLLPRRTTSHRRPCRQPNGHHRLPGSAGHKSQGAGAAVDAGDAAEGVCRRGVTGIIEPS